jgi:hypothetical protein
MLKILSFILFLTLSQSLFASHRIFERTAFFHSSVDFDHNKARFGQQRIGTLFWFGTVDDDVYLIFQKSKVQIKTNAGMEYLDQIYELTSPLPLQEVKVSVKKKEGRGKAEVIQQPTAGNNFTTIIQVLDKNGGAKEYELEIYWTK